MKHPSLEVIDEAIRLVKKGDIVFSCSALYAAVKTVAPDDYCKFGDEYAAQYKQFVWQSENGRPDWWNALPLWAPRANQAARVRALKRFRKACIDAAKTKRGKK